MAGEFLKSHGIDIDKEMAQIQFGTKSPSSRTGRSGTQSRLSNESNELLMLRKDGRAARSEKPLTDASYIVQEVRNSRKNTKHGCLYFVKWQGYKDPSWEYPTTIAETPEAERFHREHPMKPKPFNKNYQV